MLMHELKHELRHCSGSLNYYRWMFGGMVYTDGVRIMAETAKAYWLIDACFSHMTKRVLAEMGSRGTFTLTVADGSAVLSLVSVETGKEIDRQEIEYTDFPSGTFELFVAWGGPNNALTLFLPSED